KATSSDGSTETADFTIAVSNVNDNAPAIADASVSLDENVAAGTAVTNVNDSFTGTDLDRDGDAITYSITDGNEDGIFVIDAATGAISIADGKTLDYETASQHVLTVTASDGTLSDTATITVNVNNLNDNPVLISDSDAAANTVAENAANGTTVGVTALGTDADADTTVTYELTDDADGRFAIDKDTGVITVADGSKLDYESATSHTVTVKATSSDGSTETADFTIAVSNVNDNAPAIADASVSLDENVAA
ncbi:cadherin repeat domain-containing protein, partial [Pseudomonas stutzeri]|nr:cadherin repeat domain-containing protein [Stutzerimonas stutzeri]